jgi:hypothetical protein
MEMITIQSGMTKSKAARIIESCYVSLLKLRRSGLIAKRRTEWSVSTGADRIALTNGCCRAAAFA